MNNLRECTAAVADIHFAEGQAAAGDIDFDVGFLAVTADNPAAAISSFVKGGPPLEIKLHVALGCNRCIVLSHDHP
ncbi:MAG: hypothetical protein PVJ77_09450 [Desulfobacterales bacterium]